VKLHAARRPRPQFEPRRDPREITVSAVVRTAQGTRRREPREIAEDIEQYARAGCDLALVEAVACNPDDAAPEIERLTRLCASVTAA
jgi:hypothetical protein